MTQITPAPASLTSTGLADILHRWVNAWNGQDVSSLVALFDDNAELVSPQVHQLLGKNSAIGKESLRELFTRTLANAPSVRLELLDHVWQSDHNKAVVLYRIYMNGFNFSMAQAWRFLNGRIVHAETFSGVRG